MWRALSAAVALACVTPAAWAQGATLFRGDCQGRQATSWSINIAADDEPGERLIVEGRVIDLGGDPLPGITVFVFHTDARGYYSTEGMDESNARLCGLMLTDPKGRYRFESIQPAHYATGGPPRHVHYRVWGPGVSRQGFSLSFEGDPLLGNRGRDASANPTWATIRSGTVDSAGVHHVQRDLRVR